MKKKLLLLMAFCLSMISANAWKVYYSNPEGWAQPFATFSRNYDTVYKNVKLTYDNGLWYFEGDQEVNIVSFSEEQWGGGTELPFVENNIYGDIHIINENNLVFYTISDIDKTCALMRGSWDWGDTSYSQITIPDHVSYNGVSYSVTEMMFAAFRDNYNLEVVNTGNSLQTISAYGFWNCENLSIINLGNRVKVIGEQAFRSCPLRSQVILPQSIEEIQCDAFLLVNDITLSINITDLPKYLQSEPLRLPNKNEYGEIRPNENKISDYLFNGTSLTEVVVPMGITKIKGRAFQGGEKISKVIFPNGITEIGEYAFDGCTLLSIELPSSLITIGEGAFMNNPELKTANLPDNLEVLGPKAFAHDIAIYEVTIPGSVKEIGYKAFEECTDLENVSLNAGLESIGPDAFRGCSRLTEIALPEGLKTIDFGAFLFCNKLTAVNFPESLDSIGASAFSGPMLKDVKFGSNLRSVGNCAFYCGMGYSQKIWHQDDKYWYDYGDYDWGRGSEWDEDYNPGCAVIPNFKMPQAMEYVGEKAFAYCGIKTLTLSDNIQTIGREAFSYNQFTDVKIPASISAITEGMFSNCKSLKNVEFNDHITSIDKEAFFGTGIRMLDIPTPVASIGERAFANSGIVGVTFPETLTSIGARAFENTAMVSYEIPNSVTSIGENAFGNLHYLKMGTGFNDFTIHFCDGIEVLEMVSATPPSLTADRLGFTPNMVLVPEGAGAAYRDNNRWKDYNIVARNSNKAVVYLNESGTLASEIRTQTGIMPGAVTNLTIEGAALNNDDFAIIRSNMPACYEVDMSGVANTTIPTGVFNGKTGLLYISLPRGLKTIGDNAFENCYTATFTIPETVETIGSKAFANCQSMDNELKFANTLKSIGSNAFNGCRSLRSIDLSALEDISWGGNNDDDYWWGYDESQGIFGNCYALSEVKFPSKLSSIPSYMFSGSNLETLVIPASTTIGNRAFSNCSNLKQVAFEPGFNGLGNNAFENCTGLYAVVMPESVTKIGSETFRGCSALQNIIIHESLKEIGYAAFYGSGLNYIEIPAAVKLVPTDCFTQSEIVAATIDGATEIASNAFGNCPNLLVINLPASLQTVNGGSLNSPSLSAISSPSVKPAATNDNPFADVSSVTCALAVPKPSFSPYMVAEYWGKFVSIRNSIDVSQVNYDADGEEISEEENAEDPASELTYMDEEDYQEILEDMEEENGEEPQQARRKALRIMRAKGLADVNKGYGKLFNNASLFLDEKASTRFFIALADDVTSFSVTYNGKDITNQVDLNTMSFVIDGLKSSASLVITTNGHVVETGNPGSVDTIGASELDDENAPYYNLNGQIVKNPTPGIYIHNGKKVVVK